LGLGLRFSLRFESSTSSLAPSLSKEVVGVVLKALLVPPSPHPQAKYPLSVCPQCSSSVSTLCDLFFQLEKLRWQFNDLRRRIGRQVIFSSLGRSEEDWAAWEEQVRSIEKIFPSCVFNDLEEELPQGQGDVIDLWRGGQSERNGRVKELLDEEDKVTSASFNSNDVKLKQVSNLINLPKAFIRSKVTSNSNSFLCDLR